MLLQPDPSTALVAVCVLYKVGSRDEQESKTGIAHLFEHLMFSNNGPGIDFDSILQNAGENAMHLQPLTRLNIIL